MEKSICARQGIPCYTACLWHGDWHAQTLRETYSSQRMCGINALRAQLSRQFTGNGRVLEVRFFDLDLLSLLFWGCSEQEARAFCEDLTPEYQVRFCGQFPKCYAPLQLFNQWYSATRGAAPAQQRHVCVGVSYRQRYLIDVVCRDRQEARDQLLLEAADQAIRAYHEILE